MHLLISHAAPPGLQCQAAIEQLELPNLTELLGLLTALPPVTGSPDSLTPLHERVRANSLGLHGADGLLPWAALDAQQLGLTKAHGAAALDVLGDRLRKSIDDRGTLDVLRYGADAEIVEPVSLREQAKTLLQLALTVYT